MKGIIKIMVLVVGMSSLVLFNIANANSHGKKSAMWTCETNASSSDKPADKNADEMMSKKAKSAHDAFSFAYKHCRDCTKITCSEENKA